MAIDFLDSSCEANIAENFRRTNAAIEGGGLPAIESGDAGKVLTVNDDADGVEWANGGGGGGGASVLITAAKEGDIYTLNKKWSEIEAVVAAGGSAVIQLAEHYFVAVGEVSFGVGGYQVYDFGNNAYVTDSADGYPVCDMS